MVDGAQHGLAANPVGDRLRAAREEKGMSLDDVASQTRVPTRHLQHIDNGDWEALPAPTYSVGFARAYANAVGLNGTEIAAELRAQLGSGRNNAAAAVYNEPADPARVPPRSLALVAAILAILIAAGYAIWRSNAVDDTDPLTEAAAVDTPIVAPPPAAAPPQERPAPLRPVSRLARWCSPRPPTSGCGSTKEMAVPSCSKTRSRPVIGSKSPPLLSAPKS
jgi:cytoskeletal protein RodZ